MRVGDSIMLKSEFKAISWGGVGGSIRWLELAKSFGLA